MFPPTDDFCARQEVCPELARIKVSSGFAVEKRINELLHHLPAEGVPLPSRSWRTSLVLAAVFLFLPTPPPPLGPPVLLADAAQVSPPRCSGVRASGSSPGLG
ncbi:hypothetical protein E2C01_005957 [Portunus trituberculatus]|uniref:Uncharacterized protein n=1 Tax=Portunus trituberculatus TaxID=210409 RepID=A0A5B7CU14_PORTR|nr:hypothetical protein [Portunus trituberculatus]